MSGHSLGEISDNWRRLTGRVETREQALDLLVQMLFGDRLCRRSEVDNFARRLSELEPELFGKANNELDCFRQALSKLRMSDLHELSRDLLTSISVRPSTVRNLLTGGWGSEIVARIEANQNDATILSECFSVPPELVAHIRANLRLYSEDLKVWRIERDRQTAEVETMARSLSLPSSRPPLPDTERLTLAQVVSWLATGEAKTRDWIENFYQNTQRTGIGKVQYELEACRTEILLDLAARELLERARRVPDQLHFLGIRHERQGSDFVTASNTPELVPHAYLAAPVVLAPGRNAVEADGTVPMRQYAASSNLPVYRDVVLWRAQVVRQWPSKHDPQSGVEHEATPTKRSRSQLRTCGNAELSSNFRSNRGPKPNKRESIAAKMLEELRNGQRTLESLHRDTEETLAAEYNASRDTCRKARALAMSKFQGENSDK